MSRFKRSGERRGGWDREAHPSHTLFFLVDTREITLARGRTCAPSPGGHYVLFILSALLCWRRCHHL
ncbi:unnamed protein product [Ectocarpus sp. CCAP 1310/34]|nr:unnamed protein product [Ectocarpus sp. CCAP 1310/34]